MKKIFKNISSSILFIIFFWVQGLIILLISFFIIGENFAERLFDRPPVFLGPLFLAVLYTSYVLVKKNNSKSFLKRIYDKMKKNNLNTKTKNEIKDNDIETEILIENKVPKKRIISKGWLRVQIASSLLIPFPLVCLYFKFFESFFSVRHIPPSLVSNEFWGYVATLFFCQWFLFLFYFLIMKYKSTIISNFWVKRHLYLSIFFGFFVNYLFIQNEKSSPSWVSSNLYVDEQAMYYSPNIEFFPIYVNFYFFILLIYLWIARGFKDS
jgi:hypothetical protein